MFPFEMLYAEWLSRVAFEISEEEKKAEEEKIQNDATDPESK